jgi:thioredoxin 1
MRGQASVARMERSAIRATKLNVDESPKTASKYGVMSIPTLMTFKGGEMTLRQVGAVPKQKLQQWITAAV